MKDDLNKQTFTTNPNTGNIEEGYDELLVGKEAATSFYWKMTNPKTVSFLPPAQVNDKYKTSAENIAAIGGYGPAPSLLPINRGNDVAGAAKLTSNTPTPSVHVNVRDEHHWTESPITSRREVPILSLKENKIMTNVALNQMLNMVSNAAGAAGEAVKSVNKLFDMFKSKSLDDTANSDENKNNMTEEAMKKEISSGTLAAVINPDEIPSPSYFDPMNPYSLLYTTQPTGFKYSIPYMENTYVQNTGGFGDSAAGGTISNILQNLGETATNFLQELNMNKTVAPGRMIEKPKGFSFDGREKSYTVSFPLFNTKSYAELIKNWQFLFLLSYQNSPNRINRDLIDPPCIYEASISGVWYSKYAALTNLTVDFVGARREMMLPIQVIDHAPDAGNQQTATGNWIPRKRKTLAVIPDAYQVTMTFTELFAETQNFKFQMLREAMNDVVQTGIMER